MQIDAGSSFCCARLSAAISRRIGCSERGDAAEDDTVEAKDDDDDDDDEEEEEEEEEDDDKEKEEDEDEDEDGSDGDMSDPMKPVEVAGEISGR